MYLFSNLNEKQYNFLNYLLLLIFFFYSVNFYRYIYDPHHFGLMFSNAVDILENKKPYSEIFIQYGVVTTFLHALIIKLIGQEVFYLNIFTILIYTLTILIISKTAKILTNNYYSFLVVLVLVLNHPVVWLPWSNYVAYFFLSLSIYFLAKNKFNDNYPFGLFLVIAILARQDYFLPLILFFSILILIKLIIKKIFFYKSFISLVIPIFFFFSYLIFNDVYYDWKKTIEVPKLYLEYLNTNIFSLIYNFIYFFITKTFFNFINFPQYCLILFILTINFIFFYFALIKKNYDIFCLILFTFFLCAVSINLELFRLYTSVSFGIITTVIFLHQLKNILIKNYLTSLILFFSIFSIIFYPSGNNPQFNKIIKEDVVLSKNKFLKHINISQNYENGYLELNSLLDSIYKNCNILYAENLTFDTMISVMLKKDRLKFKPYVKSESKNDRLENFFDNQFVSKINSNLNLKNTIIVSEFENLKYDIGVISFPSNYLIKSINFNNLEEKPKNIYVYYPKECML